MHIAEKNQNILVCSGRNSYGKKWAGLNPPVYQWDKTASDCIKNEAFLPVLKSTIYVTVLMLVSTYFDSVTDTLTIY
jgi:hypothetical protein